MREMAEKIEVNISTIQRHLIDLSFCYQITTYEGDTQYVIDADTCISCGSCAAGCPVEAISEE